MPIKFEKDEKIEENLGTDDHVVVGLFSKEDLKLFYENRKFPIWIVNLNF